MPVLAQQGEGGKVMKRIGWILGFVAIASLMASSSHAQCIICHEVIPDPPYVTVIRDCLASGCHDTLTPENGNHHTTGVAMAGRCTPCHDPNLVEDYDDENPVSSFPASSATPTVQSCTNCHKGHATPLDENENPYPHPIYDTETLEHMESQGYVTSCTLCHGDPPEFDPSDPYLIRYCETCHSVYSLHKIAGHAVVEPDPLPYDGYWYDEDEVWTQITQNDRCLACHGNPAADTMAWVSQDVGTYDTTYSELTAPDCRACHGENTADRHHHTFDCNPPQVAPVIRTDGCEGMSPVAGVRLANVTLTGTDFGDDQESALFCGDYKVQMKEGDTWEDIPVTAWTETLIDGTLPPWTFSPNEYHNVRVITPTGISNEREFYVLPTPTVARIEDDSGSDAEGPACGWLTVYSTLSGGLGTFSDARQKWYEDPLGGTCPNFFGSIYVVTFTSSSGHFCATQYDQWNASGNNDSFKVRLANLWADQDGDYFKDATEPSCGPYTGCDLALGSYSVQVCLIIYADTNADSGFSGDEDTIYQVVKSKSDVVYNISADPVILKLVPAQIQRSYMDPGPPPHVVWKILRIYGSNFGPIQGNGQVRVGTAGMYLANPFAGGLELDRIALWSNTLIRSAVVLPPIADGMTVYVWVTKDGMVADPPRPLYIIPLGP
jgi:hypothetical protein